MGGELLESIARSYDAVYETVLESLEKCGRNSDSLKIVGVSKRQPIEKLLAYECVLRERGHSCIFGENYVQEAVEKRAVLSTSSKVHLIGPLQSNKAAQAVDTFDLIQSVHSEKIAVELDKRASTSGSKLEVYLQINISEDSDKRGFARKECLDFLPRLESLPAISLKGLMTITRLYDDPEQARPDFRSMAEFHQEVQARCSSSKLELSMGMSADYPIAIEEGATVVRLGTVLFGPRNACHF